MTFDWVNAAKSTLPSAKWTPVSASRPCPICGKPDWCSIDAVDGTVLCMRIAAGSAQTVTQSHGTGYLHKIGAKPGTAVEQRPTQSVPCFAPKSSQAFTLDYRAILQRWEEQTTNAALLAFAEALGVDFPSLERLGAVWCQDRQSWAFPMHDGIRRVVGIRFRTSDGRKFALPGSHAGIFVPAGLNSRPCLFICEGPTDTAAAITLGLDAIGRPSCSGGTEYICDLLQMGRRRDVVIIADADGPGRFGANQLGERLVGICQSVKVIDTAPHKDLREWIRTRGTDAVIDELIQRTGLRQKDGATCS